VANYPSVSSSKAWQIFFCWSYFILYFTIFSSRKDSMNINFPGVFMHRKIGFVEHISRELLFTRNGIIAFIIALFIGNCSVGIKNFFQNKDTETTYQAPRQQPVYQNQNQSQMSVADKVAQDLENLQKQQNNANNYRSDTTAVVRNQNNSSATTSNNSNNNEWQPNKEYYSTITWDNLVVRDEFSINASLPKGIYYVDIEGNFVASFKSDNYYPHVYVDGYEGDNDFFSNFFRVHINKITFKSGEIISNSDVELSVYISVLKTSKDLLEDCYRNIRIYSKPQFKDKIRWHVLDAGWGVNFPFKLNVIGNQYMTSLNDSKKFNIPMFVKN
jgi:hypothetical protein